MGGDQFEQLINEYLKTNAGFIALIVILVVISLGFIIFGTIMSIVQANKKPKLEATKVVTKQKGEGGKK